MTETYTYWPAMLPQAPAAGRFQYAPQSNKVSFKPDIGPSIDRRRASSVVKICQVGFDLTTFEQLQEFERWFEDDLSSGVHPFLWEDPTISMPCLWKFAAEDPPYQVDAQRGTYVILSFKLQRLRVWTG